jgi:hypothetical protein
MHYFFKNTLKNNYNHIFKLQIRVNLNHYAAIISTNLLSVRVCIWETQTAMPRYGRGGHVSPSIFTRYMLGRLSSLLVKKTKSLGLRSIKRVMLFPSMVYIPLYDSFLLLIT